MATYTIPCPSPTGCNCGEPQLCEICEFSTLEEFAESYNWPTEQTPDSSFPFTYSGANMVGITNIANSDIFSNGSYLKRAGCSGTGAPYIGDEAMMYFNGVVKRNFTFSYEYYIDGGGCVNGGKHRFVMFVEPENFLASNINIGSWSTDQVNSVGFLSVSPIYYTNCILEYPLSQLSGIPQTFDQWRTRTLVKQDQSITFTDGEFSTVLERCWFPLNGTLGMLLGPNLRIRNITISV